MLQLEVTQSLYFGGKLVKGGFVQVSENITREGTLAQKYWEYSTGSRYHRYSDTVGLP